MHVCISPSHTAVHNIIMYTLYTVLYYCVQGQDGSSHYLVQAKLAILNKQFKLAESLLLERVGTPPNTCITHTSLVYYECSYNWPQGEVEQAMAMYQELHRWEDAIAVAEARVSEWVGGCGCGCGEWVGVRGG